MSFKRETAPAFLFDAATAVMLHIAFPADQQAEQNNAAVEACAQHLTTRGAYTSEMPWDCGQFTDYFIYRFQNQEDNDPQAPWIGHNVHFYVPSADQFKMDQIETPAEIADRELGEDAGEALLGLFAGAAFLGVRHIIRNRRAWVAQKRHAKAQTSADWSCLRGSSASGPYAPIQLPSGEFIEWPFDNSTGKWTQ